MKRTSAEKLLSSIIGEGRLISYSCSAWNSATFSGARHNYVISYPDPAQARRAASLDLSFPDFLIADIEMKEVEGGHAIAILTLDGGIK